MKTRTWILIFVVLFLIFVGLALSISRSSPAQEAEIYSNGALVRTVRLDKDQVFTIDSAYGSNTITISGGKLAVTEATCPDHICQDRGYCAGGLDIVCLPNRLVVHFVGGANVDGVIG